MMEQVTLEYLQENIDSNAFDEVSHPQHKTDYIFYDKSYDGGEHHEIHTIYIVEHDPNDITKPYTIYYYTKEYMWNWHTSFEQEPCELIRTTTCDTLSEVIYYLTNHNVISNEYTSDIHLDQDKYPFLTLDTTTNKVSYEVSIAWSDSKFGNYCTLIKYVLDLHTINKNNFNNIHNEIVNYLKKLINILHKEPLFIVNKMSRMNKGPFKTIPIDNRYNHWMEEDTPDVPDVPDVPNIQAQNVFQENVRDTYNDGNKYFLDGIRLDIFQLDKHNEIINTTLLDGRKIYSVYDTFYVYRNIYNKNKTVWRFDTEDFYQLDIYDSYWTRYENRLYGKKNISKFQTENIQLIVNHSMLTHNIIDTVINNSDTTDSDTSTTNTTESDTSTTEPFDTTEENSTKNKEELTSSNKYMSCILS